MRNCTTLLLAAALAPVAGAESSALLPYDGRSGTAANVRGIELILSFAPVDAAGRLAEKLPALVPGEGTVQVELVDVVAAGGTTLRVVPDLLVRPFEVRREAPDGMRIVLFAEPFFHDTVDTIREAARAQLEAHLALRLGDAWDGLPRWMQDGLALWVLDEEDAATTPEWGLRYAPEQLVPGFGELEWRPLHRFQDRMAFHHLASRGSGAVARFVAAVKDGVAPEEALATAAAASLTEFHAAATAFARERLAARRTDAAGPLLDGFGYARAGDWTGALDQAQAVVGQPAQTLHPEALLLGARALNALGNPQEARAPLEHFFHLLPGRNEVADAMVHAEPVPILHLVGPAWLEKGRAEETAGAAGAAAAAYAKVLDLAPAAELVEEALLGLARCEAGLHRRDEARAHLTLWLSAFAGSPRAAEARALEERLAPDDG